MFTGRKHSLETKAKMSKSHRGPKPKISSALKKYYEAGGTNGFKGGHHSEEAKRKIGLASLGRPCWTKGLTKDTDERIRKMAIVKAGRPSNFRGKYHTPLAKEKNRKKHLELLKDPEYLKKILTCRKPNNSEVKLLNIIKAYGFVFVGNGKLIIGGRNPDFVDYSKHKIIELFGKHWHDAEEVTNSIEFFRGHGYDALVIWDEELKNKDSLTSKIKDFLGLTKNVSKLSREAI